MVSIGIHLFFLGLLEVGLWAAGHVYFHRNEGEEILHSSGSDPRQEEATILCVGDSFTWGGQVKREEAYPAQLQRRLDSEATDRSFRVVNAGVCKMDTYDLLQRLPAWLEKYDPEIMVLLIGSGNLFNSQNSFNLHSPNPYSIYIEEKSITPMKRWFFSLRTVKLLHILWLYTAAPVYVSFTSALDRSDHGGVPSPEEIVEDHLTRWNEAASVIGLGSSHA
ncbi:GDSL-type esterase/lipase family protein, partial [Thermodesulfobacteriota bacterium]